MTTLNTQTIATSSASTRLADVFATVKPGQHVLVDVLGISTNAGRTADKLGLHATERDSLELVNLEPLEGEDQVTKKYEVPNLGHWSVMNGHLSFTASKDALKSADQGGAFGRKDPVLKQPVAIEFQVRANTIGQDKDAPIRWFVGVATVTIVG